MNKNYESIWKEVNSPAFTESEDPDEHALCYTALHYASEYETGRARETLKKISINMPGHSCSFVLEATSLVYFSLREFTAAKEFALDALKRNPASFFACQVLARLAIFEKNYADAIRHYQNILDQDLVSDRTLLNMAETYYLMKEFDSAIRYTAKAQASLRKRLYTFFLSFSYWRTRLLWMFLVIISFMISPYLFFSIFVLATVFLAYVAIQFGYRKGDLLIYRRSIYIQFIHSIFFALAFCATVSYLINR